MHTTDTTPAVALRPGHLTLAMCQDDADWDTRWYLVRQVTPHILFGDVTVTFECQQDDGQTSVSSMTCPADEPVLVIREAFVTA